MTADIHLSVADAAETPTELGAKYIRWGFGLFIFWTCGRLHPLGALHAWLV